MNEYFLQVAVGRNWEEVDAYLYKNYKFVVNDEGIRRYTDNCFSVVDGEVNISELKNPSKVELSLVCRILGLTIPTGTTGFCSKPKGMLTIVRGNAKMFYQDGFKYTGRAAA